MTNEQKEGAKLAAFVAQLQAENTRCVFQVIVGNIGTVYDGPNRHAAMSAFREYRHDSIRQEGRAAGEPVWLMANGDMWREHQPMPHERRSGAERRKHDIGGDEVNFLNQRRTGDRRDQE